MLDPKSTRTFEKCLFHWIRPSTSPWRLSCRKVWHKNSSGIVYTFDFSFNTFDAISCHLELLGSFRYSASYRISGIGDFSFTTSIGTKVSLLVRGVQSLEFFCFNVVQNCSVSKKIYGFDFVIYFVLKCQTEIQTSRGSALISVLA